MATNQEIFDIIAQVRGQAEVNALSKQIDVLTKELMDLDATSANYTTRSQDLAGKIANLRPALEQAEKAAGKASVNVKNLGEAARDSGRFFQDLAQGGIPGVLNNLEGLGNSIGKITGMSAGMTTAIGGALTIAGTLGYVLYQNWDQIVGLFDQSIQKIPQATDALQRHKDKLQEINKQVDDLKEKQMLSTEELGKYNDLLKQRAEIEKAISKEEEQRQQRKALAERKTSREQQFQAAFNEIIPDVSKSEDLVSSLQKFMFPEQTKYLGLQKEYDAINQRMAKGQGTDADAKRFRELAIEMNKLAGSHNKQFGTSILDVQGANTAASNVVNAAAQGNEASINKITQAVNAGFAPSGKFFSQWQEKLVAGMRTDEEKKKIDAARSPELGQAVGDVVNTIEDLKKQTNSFLQDWISQRKRDNEEKQKNDKTVKDLTDKFAPRYLDDLAKRDLGKSSVTNDQLIADLAGRLGKDSALAPDVFKSIDAAYRDKKTQTESKVGGVLPDGMSAPNLAAGKILRDNEKAQEDILEDVTGSKAAARAAKRAEQAAARDKAKAASDLAGDYQPQYMDDFIRNGLGDKSVTRKGMEKEVASRLKAEGQDPALASDIVEQMHQTFQEKHREMTSQMGRKDLALIRMMQELMQEQERLNQQFYGVESTVNQMQGQMRMNRMRRTGLPTFR